MRALQPQPPALMSCSPSYTGCSGCASGAVLVDQSYPLDIEKNQSFGGCDRTDHGFLYGAKVFIFLACLAIAQMVVVSFPCGPFLAAHAPKYRLVGGWRRRAAWACAPCGPLSEVGLEKLLYGLGAQLLLFSLMLTLGTRGLGFVYREDRCDGQTLNIEFFWRVACIDVGEVRVCYGYESPDISNSFADDVDDDILEVGQLVVAALCCTGALFFMVLLARCNAEECGVLMRDSPLFTTFYVVLGFGVAACIAASVLLGDSELLDEGADVCDGGDHVHVDKSVLRWLRPRRPRHFHALPDPLRSFPSDPSRRSGRRPTIPSSSASRMRTPSPQLNIANLSRRASSSCVRARRLASSRPWRSMRRVPCCEAGLLGDCTAGRSERAGAAAHARGAAARTWWP